MSEANKLLDSLTEDQISMYTATPETEPHIVIGADRFAIVPDELKRIAVQFDHNIETVTFDCPRYWDDHDMSKMQIYINYTNGSIKGSYVAQNVTVNGGIMHFDWTISRNVTQYKGPISFLVCVKKTDADGEEVNHWNSELNTDMYVSEGLEVTETVLASHPDIITQLLTRMDTVEEVAVTVEELEVIKTEVLAAAESIIGTKEFVDEKAEEIRNSYSNALKYNVSGEIIRIDDISPVEHTVKGIIHGKNLWNMSNIAGTDSVTINDDGSATVAGGVYYARTTTILAMVCPALKVGDVVTFSIDTDATGSEHIYLTTAALVINQHKTITITSEMLESCVVLYGLSDDKEGYDEPHTINHIQLEYGESATEYEPYIDPANITVVGTGRNIIPYPYTENNAIARAGIIYSNTGGVIKATGTSTGSYLNIITTDSKQLYLIKGKTYSFRCISDDVVNGNAYAYVKDAASINYFDRGNGCTFTPSKSGYGAVTLVVPVEKTVNGATFKPILEYGLTTGEFELYKGTTFTTVGSGLVDITSVSPTMTIFAHAPGAIVDVEYNMDTMAYIKRRDVNMDDEAINEVITSYIDSKPDQFKGKTPVKGVDYFTDEDKAEFHKQLTPEYVDSIEGCVDTSKVYVLPDGYIYAYALGETEAKYTNILDSATVNLNKRYNSSDELKDVDGYIALEFPVAGGDVIRFKPSSIGDDNVKGYCRLKFYNAGGTKIIPGTDSDIFDSYKVTVEDDVASLTAGYYNTTLGDNTTNVQSSYYSNITSAKVNLCISTSAITEADLTDVVITINEEIASGGTDYAWRNTGLAFVPADYEDRIIELETKMENNTSEDEAFKAEVETEIANVRKSIKNLSEYTNSIVLGEIFAPSPQMAANNSGSDFNAETCQSTDILSYFDDLCSTYPNYITGELMGKDESGSYDIKRYVLSKRYYNAWCKQNYPKMYAWVNGSVVIYSTSVSPRINDTLYSTPYIGTSYGTVTAVDTTNQTRTINGLAFTHDPSQDVAPTLVYTTVIREASNAIDNGIYNVSKSRVGTLSSIAGTKLTDANGSVYNRYPFGDRNKDMDEPMVVTIGANEHGPDPDPRMCAIICARLAKDLCECKNSGNEMLKYLKNNVTLVILPVINPYGFNLGESTPKGTGYYNYNGVNINRNYDCPGFGLETNAGPCGEYGGSENETQYFMNTLAEPNSMVGISIHALGHRTEGEFNGVPNTLCHYQGNGFDAEKIKTIAEVMKCNYNSNFTSYNTAPLETTAKSPTYITKVGAKGGIIEMQPMEGDTLNFLTAWTMEANYTLLLECIYMWLTDAQGV